MGKVEKPVSFRWGIPLFDEGGTMIPNFILDCYSAVAWEGKDGKKGVGVTNAEMMFVIHLARYRFEVAGSVARPRLTSTLRRAMGYESGYGIIRVLASLEFKGLVAVTRVAGLPSEYDFSALSAACAKVFVQRQTERVVDNSGQDPSPKSDPSPKGDDHPSPKSDDHPSPKSDDHPSPKSDDHPSPKSDDNKKRNIRRRKKEEELKEDDDGARGRGASGSSSSSSPDEELTRDVLVQRFGLVAFQQAEMLAGKRDLAGSLRYIKGILENQKREGTLDRAAKAGARRRDPFDY